MFGKIENSKNSLKKYQAINQYTVIITDNNSHWIYFISKLLIYAIIEKIDPANLDPIS